MGGGASALTLTPTTHQTQWTEADASDVKSQSCAHMASPTLVWLRTQDTRPLPTADAFRQWRSVVVGACRSESARNDARCVPVSSLDTNKTGLLNELQSRTTGPGRAYVLKLMLPWLLPRVERAIVLDFDLWVREPLERLAREFDAFARRHMVGVVPDIAAARLYPDSPLGANGGVQLMHLRRMREEGWERMLRRHTEWVGYLGDQTVHAHLARLHTDRYRRLSCRYNRQLNTHFWLPTSAYTCADGCAIVHGNQPRFKRLSAWPSTATCRRSRARSRRASHPRSPTASSPRSGPCRPQRHARSLASA